MRILVLNGSPSGNASVTFQTMEYLRVLNPEHEYEVLHVGQQIRRFEREFSKAREALERAELIVFCYPVYTFLTPAQMHRFIELMKESGVDYTGKYATQLTTSKHFYDMTAHRFVTDNCADMKLRCIRGLSADMDDLLTEKGQKEAQAFFQYVMWKIQNGYSEWASAGATNARFEAVQATEIDGVAEAARATVPSEASVVGRDAETGSGIDKSVGRKRGAALGKSDSSMRIALVTDYDPAEEVTGASEVLGPAGKESAERDPAVRESGLKSPLAAMIDRFCQRFPGKCEIVNLHEFPFAGGCLGCLQCIASGKCVYKDGFDSFLREHINSADAVVYAFTIKDHSMGHRFKLFDDRQFCNGHRTVMMGKPVGYLVDGDLAAEENLRTLIAARAEVGGNFLAGVASDASDPDREIDQLAQELAYAIERGYAPPKNFYGVGGIKIFRDLTYEMQGMMKEDHRFYKKHGFYDYPQKKRGKIAMMYLVGALMGNQKLMQKSKFSVSDGMLMPYRKVIERAKSSQTLH